MSEFKMPRAERAIRFFLDDYDRIDAMTRNQFSHLRRHIEYLERELKNCQAAINPLGEQCVRYSQRIAALEEAVRDACSYIDEYYPGTAAGLMKLVES
jgi:chromosome segregation ATPase